jgi:hypothetical protein
MYGTMANGAQVTAGLAADERLYAHIFRCSRVDVFTVPRRLGGQTQEISTVHRTLGGPPQEISTAHRTKRGRSKERPLGSPDRPPACDYRGLLTLVTGRLRADVPGALSTVVVRGCRGFGTQMSPW